jgi:hypothetical protein
MSGKMTLVYLEHTGHVLAALREPASGAPKLDALVGDAFPLRAVRRKAGSSTAASFDLPASVLKSKSVALDERVIARPQSFVIDGDLVALLPDSATGPTISDLSPTVITLMLGGPPSAVIKVLSVVRGNTVGYREQRIQAGSFAVTSASLSLNLAVVPSGPDAALRAGESCDVAIAFAGLPLIYMSDTT